MCEDDPTINSLPSLEEREETVPIANKFAIVPIMHTYNY